MTDHSPLRSPVLSVKPLLLVDAACCLAMGLLLVSLPATIEAWTGIPTSLSLWAGLILFPVAGLMAWLGSRPAPPRAGLWLVIAGNEAWIVASVLILATGWIAPNALGTAFILAQAAFVAGITTLEFLAARRMAVAEPA